MTHYQLVASNKRRSTIIIAGFIFFTVATVSIMVAALNLDTSLIALASIFSGVSALASYWWSDKIILAISSARPASREEFFDFYTTVENLSMSQRLPMPRLFVIDDSAMNAFATGRNPENAVICATTGLLSRLNRSEVEAVMAHELAHVANYDILLMSLVAILVGMISLLSDWFLRMGWGRGSRKNDRSEQNQLSMAIFIAGLLLALLSPLVAQLIKLAISRRREHLADSTGVAFTKNPAGLANALLKISQDKEPLEAANKATAHLFIANPLKNHHDAIGWFSGLFQTHPSIKDRVENLQRMIN